VTDSTGKWRAIEAEFLATGDAGAALASLTLLRDQAVTGAFRAAMPSAPPHGVAIVAAGAYGRGRTYPYSELDLVLLADSSKPSETLNDRLPEFVRLLWNAGLRPNAMVQTVAECIELVERAGVRAFGLLDRRLLHGDRILFDQFETKLQAALANHREKLCERLCQSVRTRHAAHGNTPFEAQPDVKESPGGLEDARAVEWLALLKGNNPPPEAEPGAAVSLLSSVRCFLHFHAQADRNLLDFPAKASLAGQPFAFDLREYFRCARAIFNQTRRAIDESEKSETSLLDNFREYRSRLSNQEFTVSRERLLLRNPAQLASDPPLVLRLLEFIARHGVAPSPETGRRLESARDAIAAWCAQPRPVWTLLKIALASPHAAMALRALQFTGVLSALLPEWQALEGSVNPASEYRYTLEEQTLRAVEALLALAPAAPSERQRFAAMLPEIDDVSLLVFALLFVEMGDSAVERARAAAVRMEMPADARDRLEFSLVHRSDLADAMTGRDLDDPSAVRQLADRVGTIEQLRVLAMITYARIAAASDADRLAWRLEQLWRASSAVQHELLRELETDRIRQVPADLPANAAFVKGFPQRYLRAHSSHEIQGHLLLFEQSRPTGAAARLESIEGAYRVTIVARDKPSLFASFAGAISSFGLDILKAEAFSNAAGVVLDTFVVADPKRMLQLNPSESDRLRDLLQRVALGRTDAQKLMRARTAPDPHRRGGPPRIVFDSDACATATLVEIDAEDRPGLLYSLASVFSSSACNIDIVLVDTKGCRAIDVFYVAHDGRKLPPEIEARLKEKLLAAC